MSEVRDLGPIKVAFPTRDEWIRPDHEQWAVGLVIPKARVVQGRVPGDPAMYTMLACSREEWMAFVAAVKAGGADVPIPGDRRST